VRNPAAEGLEMLVAERGDQLMRAALALAGSRPEGEDLLQEALERLLRNWRRVEDPEGYLRRTLYNLAADGWRRRGRWHSRMPLVQAACRETAADATAAIDLRDELVQALGQLPPQQRTVVVLRYWEQRTEAETAALLGISEGAVKSAASRGLQRLRDLVVAWPGPDHGTRAGVSDQAGPKTDAELTEGRR
jgi:RNA polymerase sigma-70 factor (sigma-E family)